MSVYIDAVTGQLVVKDMTFNTLQDLFDFFDAACNEYELTGSIEGAVGEYLSTGRMSDGVETSG